MSGSSILRSATRRRRAIFGTAMAAATIVAAAAPAGADPGTLYAATPSNGWGHDGTAYGVEIVGDTVFVGGTFANAVRLSQSQAHQNLMAVQRSTGNVVGTFNPSANATVRSIVSDGASLFIAGDFLNVNGQARQRVARLGLGDDLLPFNVSANKAVRDLLYVPGGQGTLYLVGDFTVVNGQPRKRAAAVNATTGALLPFNPNLSNKTYAVAMSPGGRLYLGGNFTTVGGTARSYLAQVDPTSGAVLAPVFSQLGDIVLDLSVTDSRVYVAGGGGFNSAAAWDVNGGNRLWRAQANGDVQAIEYSNNNVYFGFHDGFGGNTALRVLAADARIGATEGAIEPGFQPASGGGVGVWGIAADGDYLAVVGKFPKMGGFNVKGVSIHT